MKNIDKHMFLKCVLKYTAHRKPAENYEMQTPVLRLGDAVTANVQLCATARQRM